MREGNPIHLVSAWVSHNELILGQIKTDEKSNEITAIPELVAMPVARSVKGKTTRNDNFPYTLLEKIKTNFLSSFT